MLTAPNKVIAYDEVDYLSGMDFNQRYSPEYIKLPFPRQNYDAKAGTVSKEKLLINFADKYILDDKAKLKNLPADAVWQNAYQRVGFTSTKKEIAMLSISLEMTSNDSYYALGTIAQRQQSQRLEIFRDQSFDLYYSMCDYGMYFGKLFNNPDIEAYYPAFANNSTNPVDVGLPATITGGSLTDLDALVEGAIDYLQGNGLRPTREDQIFFIVGSKIARQSFAVIDGSSTTFGLGMFRQIFSDAFNAKYGGLGGMFVSPALGNNMIVCDKGMIELLKAHEWYLEKGTKTYSREYDKFLSSAGMVSVYVADERKSLFYQNVLQDPAMRNITPPAPNVAGLKVKGATIPTKTKPAVNTEETKIDKMTAGIIEPKSETIEK